MIQAIEKGIRRFTNTLCYVGMGLLVVLMFLGSFDVIGRYFFNKPIKGAYEVSEILLAGIVFFGLAYALAMGGHVTVDTFVALFRPRVRGIVGFSVSAIAFIIFVLIGWEGTELAIKSWENHRLIDVLFVPIAPFQLLVPMGALSVCLELIVQMFRYYREAKKEN